MAPRGRLRLLQLEDRVTPSVSILTSFPAMNFGNTPGAVPPDTIAAAGPTSVVETVNNDIAIYNKSGTPILSPTGLSSFFSSVGPIHSLTDSVVEYNELLGQFFVGVQNLTTNFLGTTITGDTYLYAVSNNSSPTSASDFRFFSANLTTRDPAGSGSYWGDFPRLGWNANAYVVTFNAFTTNSAQSYNHSLALNISSSAPGTNTVVDVPGGVTNSTLVPAAMHGAAATDPMYFLEETLDSVGNPTGNSIRVATETNLFTTPTFTFTNVGLPAADDYSAPPAATQKGTTNLITANDSRMLNAEWRGNHLVAAQAVGVSSDAQAHARWYELDTTSDTLIQAGTVGVGVGANSYFPSIAIAANDVLAMTYMESSPSEYMSMWVTGRGPADPTGQMEAPQLAQAGQAPYHGFGSVFGDPSPFRAGDFSGVTVDGDGTFWAANEYATSATSQLANWGTAIAHFQVSTSSPPTINSINASPSPAPGTSTVLTVSATDPNPGASITSYTWSVQPGGPSGVTFDSNNGTAAGNQVTATFTQTGNYTFQVTVTDSLGASATATVGVMVSPTLSAVAVSPGPITVVDGGTQQFTATALDQFNHALSPQPGVTWAVVGPGGSAAAGSISGTGLYTAPASGSGTDTVEATASDSTGTATGTAAVMYAQPPTVTQASATLSGDGKSASLNVSATDPNGAAITSYKWTVAGPGGVTFSSNNGTATGNSASAYFTQLGTYTFTVTVTDSLGASSTSTASALTVGQVLTRVTVSPGTATVVDGSTNAVPFSATVIDQFGGALSPQPSVTWVIAAGGKGSIGSGTGQYTPPPAGSGSGTDTVNASASNSTGSATGTATVTYTAPQPPTVTQQARATLSANGKSASLSVSATDPNGAAITNYTWTVTGPGGVTFSSNNGTATGNSATAFFTQVGTYTFTVTITDALGATNTSTTQLTVGQVVTTITVSPATATVPRNTTKQFTAAAFDQFGGAFVTQPAFTWSIDSGGIGTISSTGLYRAPRHNTGHATVRVTSGSVSGTALVTVT
jgi:hypothetical protein